MALYEFKCESCSLVVEVMQPMSSATFEDRVCTRCGKAAKHVISGAPMVSTSGMSNAPIDVVVGRDAEARWADIKRRQEIRAKVRQDSGEQAVSMTGRNEFTPIKGAKLRPVAVPNSKMVED